MIFEKIIGRLHAGSAAKRADTVPFEWFEQDKHILKKVASSGEEIGLRFSEPLLDGGILYEDEDRLIVLALLPCEVIRVRAHSMRDMGRACYELGNRHLPLSIAEDSVETPYDPPAMAYLQKLGFDCEKVMDRFMPSVTVKGHSHG